MLKGPKIRLTAFTICTSALLLLVAFAFLKNVAAAPQAPPPATSSTMLAGTVLGPNRKPLEGVTVSARESQKTFTTSVFTDEKGNYAFPLLDKGQYRVWVQAVGFEAERGEARLDPGKETRQDFRLRSTNDFTAQLSGAEMVAALPSDTPGNRRMKEVFQHNCTACHPPSFVLQNRFDERGWQAILTAMERATTMGFWLKTPLPIIHHFDEELVAYGGLRFDPVAGRFTDFISPSVNDPKFSIYGLAADAQGNGWWAILTMDRMGVSDISTGKAREVQLPPRPEMRAVATEEDRKFYEGKDNMTLSDNTSAPWARTPRRLAGDHSGSYIWSADFLGQDVARVDIQTMKITYFDSPIPYASIYDVEVDNNHMVWAALRNADRVGKLDPTTGKWIVYNLPTLGVEARNIAVDQKTGDVWVASFRTSKAIRLRFQTEY